MRRLILVQVRVDRGVLVLVSVSVVTNQLYSNKLQEPYALRILRYHQWAYLSEGDRSYMRVNQELQDLLHISNLGSLNPQEASSTRSNHRDQLTSPSMSRADHDYESSNTSC
jgi:hypothetical protein